MSSLPVFTLKTQVLLRALWVESLFLAPFLDRGALTLILHAARKEQCNVGDSGSSCRQQRGIIGPDAQRATLSPKARRVVQFASGTFSASRRGRTC